MSGESAPCPVLTVGAIINRPVICGAGANNTAARRSFQVSPILRIGRATEGPPYRSQRTFSQIVGDGVLDLPPLQFRSTHFPSRRERPSCRSAVRPIRNHHTLGAMEQRKNHTVGAIINRPVICGTDANNTAVRRSSQVSPILRIGRAINVYSVVT